MDQLVKFNVTDKAIGELKAKFGTVPDCSKKERRAANCNSCNILSW